ncbi:MAG TPA: sigma factor-like helix-turn-helix DNA-binding protein [Gaiellaceae bacterium]|nr:sigma factor-like helix-turn-helix DNA-binding protein [Gaiellaceae bacterium]
MTSGSPGHRLPQSRGRYPAAPAIPSGELDERTEGEAGSQDAWLYRIAVNEALMRRRRKTLPTTELQETTVSGGEDAYAAADARAFLIGRLRALPIEYRTAVVLRDIEGLSNEEVAGVLEISLAAAKSRVHRGRMQLRAELEQWERPQTDG